MINYDKQSIDQTDNYDLFLGIADDVLITKMKHLW